MTKPRQHNSTLPARQSGLSRSSRVRKANPKRRKSEMLRCYGPPERRAFVASLPCAGCGIVGFSENAHVMGNGGMSRKGNADEIAPLCSLAGHCCHRRYDTHAFPFTAGSHARWMVQQAAARTEQLWQEYAASITPTETSNA